VPVITTAVAGASVEVRRSGGGLVIEDGSPTGFTEALASLLEAPDKRREMAEQGRRVASRYDEAAHARGMIEVYSGVVENPRRRVGAS